MARSSMQYEMIQAALDGITTNKTITVYKKDVKKFCQWAKANGYKNLMMIRLKDWKTSQDIVAS
ncbi:MAG: hypothetical protein Q4E53_13105 [Eubacteriales bacterium]|nr:hypothetical protein [Eubacteriales bacterium]